MEDDGDQESLGWAYMLKAGVVFQRRSEHIACRVIEDILYLNIMSFSFVSGSDYSLIAPRSSPWMDCCFSGFDMPHGKSGSESFFFKEEAKET